MRASIYTIWQQPATGLDKIELCCAFVNRRAWRLPFEITPTPTDAMLKNNCYGIELDGGDGWLVDALRQLDWADYVNVSTNGSYNANRDAVIMALNDVGVVDIAPRSQGKIIKPVLF